jgi:transposase, IS5 family
MGNQRTFASMAWNEKVKVTRRERFLGEMEAVIPWPRLVRLIEPHYPKAGQGRQPLGLEKMLRIYFPQQWFNLSDPQAEDAIYDSESMRRFVRVELGDEVVPDETTILRFRHLLEQHGLTQAIFNSIAGLLEERRLLLRSGTIVERDHHRSAEFDQERRCDPRPGDEADPQGPQLALRDEAAHRSG